MITIPSSYLRQGTALLAIICLLLFGACSQHQQHDDELLLTALERAQWQEVYDECRKDSTYKRPETLGLRGHACIQLNKNNESYHCLNGMDSLQRQAWLQWTANYAEQRPTSSLANYLLGDAHVRTGNKIAALSCFNRAIDLDPHFPMARNARASLHAIGEKYEAALEDANIACRYAPGVAEFLVTRATIFYQNRGLASARESFTKALEIAPSFALALNGRACSEFFGSKGQDLAYQQYQLDSISALLYRASAMLDLPSFRENTRSLILEIENHIFPELEKTTYFRVSDFLDWRALIGRSRAREDDFLRFALGRTLPDTIDPRTLIEINALLNEQQLFKSYEKAFPEAIPVVWKAEAASACEDDIPCYNRSIIEEMYAGLIAAHLDRRPGMNILAQSRVTDNRPLGAKVYDALEHTPRAMRFANDLSRIVGAGTKRADVPLVTYGVTKIVEMSALVGQIGITNANRHRIENDPTHLRNMAILRHAKPLVAPRLESYNQNPGGAIANVRAKYVNDISSPYFLICSYGLGYDYYQ